MLYAAKCYWPGVTAADLEQVAGRAASTGLTPGTSPVAYLGCLLFAADDLVLCLFHGPSRAAVIAASDRLGIPRERLMDSAWLSPHQRSPEGPSNRPSSDRPVRSHSAASKIIGFDEVTITLGTTTNTADIAFALGRGFLDGTLTINRSTGAATGPVTGGTGSFAGATGTITVTPVIEKKEAITITYAS